jgi:hypothetical protein
MNSQLLKPTTTKLELIQINHENVEFSSNQPPQNSNKFKPIAMELKIIDTGHHRT